ncbi:O-antigen ligase family protein [Kitasatospora sp. NPDC052896]|uniref:O-antigen ligase family protein n=1 Tax=Kitasatospora sp. NPDC052896 TaxID=3364061 RepID=UPI0037C7EE81
MALALPLPLPTALRHPGRALLSRPSLLAAATVLLVCVPTGEEDVTAAVHVAPADLASMGLVALTGLDLLRGRTVRISRPAAVLFAAVVCAAAAATVASVDPSASLTGFVRLVQVFVLVPVAVLAALRDRTDLRLVLGAFVLAALVEGGVGTDQYLTGTGASYAGEPIRAVGTFGALDIMAMSGVVSFGLIAALALALTERGNRRLRGALLAVAAFLLVPLAVSFSRGSWIATAVAVTVLLLKFDVRVLLRGVVPALAAVVVLVGGLGAGGGGVAERLGSIGSVSGGNEDHSVSDRYDLWATARSIWADHPVTGAGPKSFPQLRDSHAPLRLSSGSDAADATIGFEREPLLSPHNMYFLVLSEQGLVGIVAYGGLFLALLLGCLRRPGPDGLAAVGLLCWILVDFLYADIGGTTTVLTSVILGIAARRALPDQVDGTR